MQCLDSSVRPPTCALQRQYRREVDAAVQQFPRSIERLLTLAKGEVGEDAGGCCLLTAMLRGGYKHC